MDSRTGGLSLWLQKAPIPSINVYIFLSYTITLISAFSLYNTFASNVELHELLAEEIRSWEEISPEKAELLSSFAVVRLLYYIVSNQPLTWVLLNTFYATLALLAKLILHFTFRELSRQERAVARASLLTCIVFDAVFLSVVTGSSQSSRIFLWLLWFAITAFLSVINQICHQRFKYISPSGGSAGIGLSLMCTAIFTVSTVLLIALAFNAHQLDVSNVLFFLVDILLCWLRSGRGVFRCILSSLSIPSDTARSLTYTTDMLVGILTEVIQLLHFVHLMFFSPVGFNLTCIFFFYHMKMAYSSIVASLNRYLKHRAIFRHIATKFPRLEEPSEELCIVCWEKLKDARRLECSHAFHDWCLMWWLEQDASCPTCRRFLPTPSEQRERPHQPLSTTWHFSGERLSVREPAKFGGFLRLPSFSIELSHNVNLIRRDDSQLTTQAEQVREMFPQLPIEAILEDLQTSGSSQATIENILEGRVGHIGIPQHEESDDDSWSEERGLDAGDPNSTTHFIQALQLNQRRDEQTHSSTSLLSGSKAGCEGETHFSRKKREMILKYRKFA